MTTANLGEGVEVIEASIPPAVKAIKDGACTQLTIVNLGEGLEEIGACAFARCTSLQRLVIPPAVKLIQDSAFIGCSNY